MLSSLPHWASCEVFPGNSPPASLACRRPVLFPWPAETAWRGGGGVEGAGMGLKADGLFGVQKCPPCHPHPFTWT